MRAKRLVPILILGIMLLNLIPIPVHAATLARAVEGEGHYTVGTYVGGAATFANLNINDGDATYLAFPNAAPGEARHSYNMLDFVTVNNGISYVTLTVVARAEENDETITLWPFVRINETDYFTGNWTLDTGVYETETVSWYLNPATGLPWVIDDLDDTVDGLKAQFGFYRPGLYESRVTFMELVVTYTATGFTSVSTLAPTTVTDTTAVFNGEVTDDGGQTVTNRGFVWDTVSVPVNPGNVIPAASGYANNWAAGAGDYGENPYTYALAVLVQGTLYYIRACSQNASGWTYGDEVSFVTLDDPSITTNDASYIDKSTARLNSYLDNSGGEACTVSFAWALTSGGPYANWAAIVVAGATGDAAGTWVTGQNPYLNIGALDSAADYTFMTRAANTVSTQYGAQLTFQADAYIEYPNEFTAIPGSTDVGLSWVLGDGATNTEVRYKLGDYPVADVIGANGVYLPRGWPMALVQYGAIHSGQQTMWVSMWLKLDEDYDATATQFHYLWHKGNAAADLALYFDRGTGSLVLNSGGVGNVFSTQVSWTSGQWYHVLASVSTTGGVGMRLRIDGGVADTNVAAVGGTPAAGDFDLGVNAIMASVPGLDGVVRDFSCGAGAVPAFDLSAAEELALYTTGTLPAGKTSNSWPFNTGYGLTEYDEFGANDGTLHGPCTWYDIEMSPIDGTRVYFDDGSSTHHTGLTPGTTYYYSAWGESGGFYSDGYATAMATTSAAIAPEAGIPTPKTPSTWFTAPDHTVMERFPLYGLVNWWADVWDIPRSTLWYIGAMLIVAALTVASYVGLNNHNVVGAVIVGSITIVAFSLMKLIPLWQLLPFAIIAFTGIVVGERR